jgi:hypothetical protein
MANPEVKSDPLELYTFRIMYKESPDGARDIQGLETNVMDEDAHNPDADIQGCIINLLGRLYDQCKELAQLPSM